MGSLGLVVVLILAAGRFLKKHGPLVGRGLPVEAVELLGRRSIDQRQSIHLVRLGSRILVIGSSAGGLHTLTEIIDPVEVDYLAGLCRRSDEASAAAQSFLSLFTRTAAAGRSPTTDDRADRPPAFGDADGRGPAEERLARKLMQTHGHHEPSLEEAHV